MSKVNEFSVIVGNVGNVYHGEEKYARKEFNEWVKLAKATQGRASGESVTMIDCNGDIAKEYIGKLDR